MSALTAKREFSVENEYTYSRRSPMRWIAAHVRRYPLFLLGFLASSVGATILFSMVPNIIGRAFNLAVSPSPEPALFAGLALTVLALVLARGTLDLSAQIFMETLAQRAERDCRDELYLSLLGKSQTFHNRQRVGDLMARASNDVRQINPMLNPGVVLIFESTTGVVVPLTFIAFIHPQLLVVPIIFVVGLVIALRHYMGALNPVAEAKQEQFGLMNAGLNESIAGIEVVKAMAQEEQEREKFRLTARAYRDSFIREGEVQARYIPVLLLAIAMAFGFGYGVTLLNAGVINVGQLVAFMGLMGLLRFPTFISIFSFTLVQMGLAGAERILELMTEETELDENRSGYSAAMQGEIVFDRVGFGHAGQSGEALRNISFRASPGETIAIVGQTGSGKSTLTRLVNRTYDVSSGRITIDGVDVREWNLARLREQVSTIEQDIFLFSRSVADNIAFGLGAGADPQAIERAADDAQAAEFIAGFKDGYETVVGERGVTLSGGQRQRIAIARALLTDPRILILDDSTSAIDSATEDKIQRAINRVLEGRTTLLITHRLSQIRRADRILVLHKGEIIDQGSHEALMARCSLYRRIFARYE
jgi:ATP-binding cassette, subfamily B, bacterial